MLLRTACFSAMWPTAFNSQELGGKIKAIELPSTQFRDDLAHPAPHCPGWEQQQPWCAGVHCRTSTACCLSLPHTVLHGGLPARSLALHAWVWARAKESLSYVPLNIGLMSCYPSLSFKDLLKNSMPYLYPLAASWDQGHLADGNEAKMISDLFVQL
eukprot:1161429-Pelagomonas_calceolata.AAC.2